MSLRVVFQMGKAVSAVSVLASGDVSVLVLEATFAHHAFRRVGLLSLAEVDLGAFGFILVILFTSVARFAFVTVVVIGHI